MFYNLAAAALTAAMCWAAGGSASAEEFSLTGPEKQYLGSIRDEPLKLAYSYDLLYTRLPDGKPAGVLTPFIEFLEKELGLTVAARQAGWYEAFQLLENDEIDLYGIIGLNYERKQRYNTVDPIFRADAEIVSRVHDPMGSLLNMHDKKIGLLTSSIIHRGIMAYLYSNRAVVYYPNMESMLDGLENGEIDCFVTVDSAEVEILRRPNVRFEFTAMNFYTDQGFISGREKIKPLVAIINRYLATQKGAELRAAVLQARRDELFRTQRLRLAREIASVRKYYSSVNMLASGVLYPVSFWQGKDYRGFQIEINDIFTELTGVDILVADADRIDSGSYTMLDRIRSGHYQVVAGTYAYKDLKDGGYNSDFTYSPPIWIDYIRAYTYGFRGHDLRRLRVGATMDCINYINWDVLTGKPPVIYDSRRELMDALKGEEIDAAFMSEMAFNYYYTVGRDYPLRQMGETEAVVKYQMIYSSRNVELNRLMDEAVNLYQVMYPQAPTQWRHKADQYKADFIRVRDAQATLYYRAGIVIALMALVILYLWRRHVKYDRQISRLMRKQRTFDLIWGDLKTGRLVSKGCFPFFRKWGLPVAGDKKSCSIEELGEVLGCDLYQGYLDDLEAMKKNNQDYLVSEKKVYSPQEGRDMYYRRYMHYIDQHRFMCCLKDITDEMNKVERLTLEATVDFLSELLTRRAMNARLLQKCGEMRQTGGRAFLIMLDIDNFKKINDSYGHDVGDEVLRKVSNIIRSADRGRALTSRWGGEEFLVAVEREDAAEVREVAQSILRLVAAAEVLVSGTEKIIKLTISAGLAELDPENYIISIQRADKALYEAKYDGKNCVRIWRPESERALPGLKLDKAS